MLLNQFSPSTTQKILEISRNMTAGGEVTSLKVEKIASSGLVGQVARIRLEYAPSGPQGPSSMILKIPSTEFEEGQKLADVEVKFYQNDIPSLSSIRTPKAYFNRLSQGIKSSFLLLEDLGEDGIVRQIDGCDKDQALAAVGELAKLHARWWGQGLGPQFGWLRTPGESIVGNFCKRWIQGYQGEWPDVLGNIPTEIGRKFDVLAARLAAGSRTVAHGDFHSQNMFFLSRKEGMNVSLIDFQFVQHASGMLDLARFLATSLQTDIRRAIEADLLRHYHSCMIQAGVEDYDFNRCIDEFRAASLWNFCTPLALHVVGITNSGKRWPSRLPILERCLAGAQDWDAIESL